MERIKRFLLEESGSSEAASSVILIAGVGCLLLTAIWLYYTNISTFFNNAAKWIGDIAAKSFQTA